MADLMSPFKNDPFSMAFQAYQTLCEKPFEAYYAQRPEGEEGYGFTEFPDDGGPPIIIVYTDFSTEIQLETLAHEMAHVAAGPEHEHDAMWKQAFQAIFEAYNRLGDTEPA